MDLVQLIKPNENEDPKVSVLRAMEEIKNFAAEAILLFIDKETAERMMQQVILCDLVKLIQSAFLAKSYTFRASYFLCHLSAFFYTSKIRKKHLRGENLNYKSVAEEISKPPFLAPEVQWASKFTVFVRFTFPLNVSNHAHIWYVM